MMKARRKRLLISATAFLVAVLMTLTACDWSRLNPANLFRGHNKNEAVVRPETAGRMTRVELLQTLLLTLNNQIPVSAAFESIPLRQSDGLTQTEFSQYISALRRAVSGTVTSFSALSTESEMRYMTNISDQSPAIAVLARNSAYYKLAYRDEAGRSSEFIIALQIDGENQPYLSREWVLRVNRLYDFMQLYFAAIDTKDENALTALLKLGETMPLTESFIEALTVKSKRTIEFYSNHVTTRVLDFSLRSILPSEAVVEQYATVGQSDERREESRTVQFLETNGTTSVVERIPETIAPADFEIRHNDKTLFWIGNNEQPANSDTIESELGPPLAHNDENCQTNISGLKNFEFRFPGIVILGEGTCENHEKWSGIIHGAALSYSEFSLGSGLKPGLPVSALYIRYPFARENNYQFNGTIGNLTYSLVVQVEQGYITKLSITRVD